MVFSQTTIFPYKDMELIKVSSVWKYRVITSSVVPLYIIISGLVEQCMVASHDHSVFQLGVVNICIFAIFAITNNAVLVSDTRSS